MTLPDCRGFKSEAPGDRLDLLEGLPRKSSNSFCSSVIMRDEGVYIYAGLRKLTSLLKSFFFFTHPCHPPPPFPFFARNTPPPFFFFSVQISLSESGGECELMNPTHVPSASCACALHGLEGKGMNGRGGGGECGRVNPREILLTDLYALPPQRQREA